MSQDRPTFSSRLVIPVSWEPVEGPPSAEALDALEQQNRGVLEVLLQRIDLDAAPRAGDERIAEALVPIRLKLDLIIEMLSRLSYRDVVLPEPREIEVGLDRISWSSPKPLAAGEWLLLRLYFNSAYREPVALLGRVVDCMPGGRNGGWHIEAALSEMPEATSESFARLVFFAHRRRLAQRPARAGLRQGP